MLKHGSHSHVSLNRLAAQFLHVVVFFDGAAALGRFFAHYETVANVSLELVNQGAVSQA